MIPDNVCTLRLTAAAGTELAGAYSMGTFTNYSPSKGVYNPKAFILHAASLRQTFVHCAKFPTAASRRSSGRVSVPIWLVILSDQLPVIGLVGYYPTNYLIGQRPLIQRLAALILRSYAVLPHLSMGYAPLEGTFPCITQPSAARL